VHCVIAVDNALRC